jgi:hypothetical protein
VGESGSVAARERTVRLRTRGGARRGRGHGLASPRLGMLVGHDRAEGSVGPLLADPFEEALELRGCLQLLNRTVQRGQFGVGEHGMNLVVAGLAHGDAVLGLAAFLYRLEVMQGDQLRRR